MRPVPSAPCGHPLLSAKTTLLIVSPFNSINAMRSPILFSLKFNSPITFSTVGFFAEKLSISLLNTKYVLGSKIVCIGI